MAQDVLPLCPQALTTAVPTVDLFQWVVQTPVDFPVTAGT